MTRTVRSHLLACAAAASLALLGAGCNGEDEAATPAPPQQTQQPEQTPTAQGHGGAPQQPPTQFDNAPGAQTPAPPEQPAPQTSGEPQSSAGSADPAPPEPTARAATTPPPAPRQQPSQPPAGATANTPEAKVRALIEKLQAQKSEAKWAEGEKTIQELEKLKGSVSTDLRDEIDNERASFRVAKQIYNQDR